ncbi:HTH domain-containing protein [Uliginosibacterium sp. H1]|uniref:HTH domain-containing protein n=1 Tax=Uliginosibacterium sp. H1 TaxID=3114757 RepID=UPI002E17F14B|nr:HTH domain-containing protein [Uliginosibacterium sp. H1]
MDDVSQDQKGASYLDLAEHYLKRENRAMSAREIVALALQEGLLNSDGKTPWQTMKSKLSTDILRNGDTSRFKRVFQGQFAIRSAQEEEYLAQRFVKSKMDEEIAVIKRDDLRRLIPSTGLFLQSIDRGLLTSLAFPMQRRIAEEDFDVIQLVSVFVVECQGRYLTHMRTGRLPETRLRGEYSLMLGGHLAVSDFSQLTLDLFSGDDDLADCSYILRELSEELVLTTEPAILSKGYLYDDSREVSTQHLGLLYLVKIDEPKFRIGERGFLVHAKFESKVEIQNRRSDFENWSWILLDHFLDTPEA